MAVANAMDNDQANKKTANMMDNDQADNKTANVMDNDQANSKTANVHIDNSAGTDGSSDVYILSIESSCDETAAAVVKNGREVLSNVIYTQIAIHTLYGGVVPEIASRKHIEKINQVVTKALDDAHMTLNEITAVAVTDTGAYRRAPGGSLICQVTCICCK